MQSFTCFISKVNLEVKSEVVEIIKPNRPIILCRPTRISRFSVFAVCGAACFSAWLKYSYKMRIGPDHRLGKFHLHREEGKFVFLLKKQNKKQSINVTVWKSIVLTQTTLQGRPLLRRLQCYSLNLHDLTQMSMNTNTSKKLPLNCEMRGQDDPRWPLKYLQIQMLLLKVLWPYHYTYKPMISDDP